MGRMASFRFLALFGLCALCTAAPADQALQPQSKHQARAPHGSKQGSSHKTASSAHKAQKASPKKEDVKVASVESQVVTKVTQDLVSKLAQIAGTSPQHQGLVASLGAAAAAAAAHAQAPAKESQKKADGLAMKIEKMRKLQELALGGVGGGSSPLDTSGGASPRERKGPSSRGRQLLYWESLKSKTQEQGSMSWRGADEFAHEQPSSAR